jgi:hypothetical protein
MKKILLFSLVAIFLATSAFAWVQTTEGPKKTGSYYVTDFGSTITSGDVVVLQTTSPTHWGKEVTCSTTAGLPIYGVIVQDTMPSATDLAAGAWIRIQTHGYCPIVKLAQGAAVTAHSSKLVTSEFFGEATTCRMLNEVPNGKVDDLVTGNIVALESTKAHTEDVTTIKALLGW